MLKSVSSITNAIGALNYKGTWNASTNTPALASGVGTKGDYYVVSVAGTTALDGVAIWGVGDWAVFNGTAWQRVEGGTTLNGTTLDVSGVSTLTGGITTSGAVNLNLGTNGSTSQAKITTNGNFLVNQATENYVSAGRGVIEIDGSSDSIFALNNGGATNTYFRAYAGNFQGYSLQTITFTSVTLGVQLTANQTSWASVSDIRLKNVIGYFENAIADVAKLEAIKFTWKSDKTNVPCVGLSAQSVQSVLPEAVTKFVSPDDETEYLSVKYTEVVPLLVAAIQELTARLETLEGK
jgi:hypothetical protein